MARCLRHNDEGLSAAARFFGVDPRSAPTCTVAGPPFAAAIALRLMLAHHLDAPPPLRCWRTAAGRAYNGGMSQRFLDRVASTGTRIRRPEIGVTIA